MANLVELGHGPLGAVTVVAKFDDDLVILIRVHEAPQSILIQKVHVVSQRI